MRYLCDVDLVELLDLAPAFRDVGDLQAYNRQRHGPVALPDFLLVLATMIAKGWLVLP